MDGRRTILVTGGNGGLGEAISRGFLVHDPGCRLWLGVRTKRAAAERLAAEYPERCRLVALDVAERAAWQRAIGEILATDGTIDVLVNNAGLHRDHLLATMPEEAWTEVIRANLDAVFHGCRAVVEPMMRQRFGRIVNISSVSACLTPVGQTNYAAAKAGVIAFTRSLAKEVARAGITVNAVLPGYIDTEALADMDEESRRRVKRTIPMRRFGRPEEVAAVVRFLACQEASYVTGSEVKIDGGIY